MTRKLPRRRGPHGSRLRAGTQLAFLVLTLVAVFVMRGNAERFCPFGGVEALYSYVTEGNVLCSIGVTNFFVLGGLLLSVLLLRRAFCAYACPIGAIQEGVRAVAAKLGVGRIPVAKGLDRFLSLFKYVALAVIIYLTWSAGELILRGFDPCYALIGRHGEDITYWAYVVSGGILLASVFLRVPFCRWLCPLAAVMNPFSKAAVGRVARDGGSCVDCGKCADVCPMEIPVNEKQIVDEARCTACLQCVDVCPKGGGTLSFRLSPFKARLPRGAIIAIFVGIMGSAVLAAELFPLPSFTWTHGTAPSGETAVIELEMEGLGCRGTANLLRYYLERDDDLELRGYVKIEAWPQPGTARVRVTYDPAVMEASDLQDAMLEPYYDYDLGTWRNPPFVIPGYDPLLGP